MTPTEMLRHDHEIILRFLEDAEQTASSINTTGQVDTVEIARMIDFLRNFADNNHHSKEEHHFFVTLVEHGMPVGHGPIAVMLCEHEEGRQLLKTIENAVADAKAGVASAIKRIADSLFLYVELLRAHIEKENEILFPIADSLLDPAEQTALTAELQLVEAAQGRGQEAYAKFKQYSA